LTRFKSIEKLLRYAPEYVRRKLKDPKAFAFNMATLIPPDQDGDELGALPFGRIVYLTGASPLHAHSA